ncbi:hypothetical protein [Autumnicola psychrophila]|uniref:Uncharacterized protein n=1 Tax=Autumnicola psychrophila TaxID=3075592 RepID=A0ABU3DUA9_9FLAO|nr:hypothetical protein [Zunongwangia sp. F225]MDT0687296.1 hypothetical protein [Zunongwangia sp. F225]
MPRLLIKKSGVWNSRLKINQDGEFFSRVILNASEIIFCPEAYVLYRTGSGNRISTQRDTKEGIDNYIKSWSLIDEAISEKLKIRNHFYVRQAKATLFSSLKDKHPEWIQNNQDFFLNRTRSYIFKLLKLQSKVRDKIFVKQVSLKSGKPN